MLKPGLRTTKAFHLPDSAGSKNDRIVSAHMRTIGNMRFVKKNNDLLFITNVYVTSGYGSGQQKYFTSLRTAGTASSFHSAFFRNFPVKPENAIS